MYKRTPPCHLLSFCFAVLSSLFFATCQGMARIIVIERWGVPENREPYPPQIVYVGDTIKWEWRMQEVEGDENSQPTLYYHPSGTCDPTDRVLVGDANSELPSYTFTEADKRKILFFTGEKQQDCLQGMQIQAWVIVRRATTPAPAPIPVPLPTLNEGVTGREDTPQPANLRQPTAEPTRPPRMPQPTQPPIMVTPILTQPPIMVTPVRLPFVEANITIVVKNGKIDGISFTDYKGELVNAIDALAVEIIDDLVASAIQNPQELLLRLELPSSITQITQSEFTPDPSVSEGGSFQGGLCPVETGNAEIDRCEIITASVRLQVLFKAIDSTVSLVDIQALFRSKLTEAIMDGRLRDTLSSSIVEILSGAMLVEYVSPADMSDKEQSRGDEIDTGKIDTDIADNEEGASTENIDFPPIKDPGPSTELDQMQSEVKVDKQRIGIIIAIITGALLLTMGIFIFLLYRYFKRRNDMTTSGTDAREDCNASPENNSQEEDTILATGLEWGDNEASSKGSSTTIVDHREMIQTPTMPTDTFESDPYTEDSFPTSPVESIALPNFNDNFSYSSHTSSDLQYSLDLRSDQRSVDRISTQSNSERYQFPSQVPATESKASSSGIFSIFSFGNKSNQTGKSSDKDATSLGNPSPWSFSRQRNTSMASGTSSNYQIGLGAEINLDTFSPDVVDCVGSTTHSAQSNGFDSMSLGNKSRTSSGVFSSSAGTIASEEIMSGARVVDFGMPEATPGIANLDDLEAAIMAGDWAALGATATTLAANQNDSASEQNSNSKASVADYSWEDASKDWSNRSKDWQDVIDATKADELAQFIEQGNWAAIVEASKRYEDEARSAKASNLREDNDRTPKKKNPRRFYEDDELGEML